jgi:hypothetical protein
MQDRENMTNLKPYYTTTFYFNAMQFQFYSSLELLCSFQDSWKTKKRNRAMNLEETSNKTLIWCTVTTTSEFHAEQREHDKSQTLIYDHLLL